MKVAFTSTDGVQIDEHFGRTRDYWIWDVAPDRAEFVTRVAPLAGAGDEEDRTAARASAVAGCAIVYTVQIGGPAAAKLVAQHVHPLKTGAPLPIADAIQKLQGVLKGTPPPWLRKALAGAAPHVSTDD